MTFGHMHRKLRTQRTHVHNQWEMGNGLDDYTKVIKWHTFTGHCACFAHLNKNIIIYHWTFVQNVYVEMEIRCI